MSHPDHETRVGAHHVFSIVLMPSLICPWLVRNGGPAQALLGFSPIASERIKNGSFSIQDESNDKPKEEVSQVLDNGVTQSIKCPSRGQSFSFKNAMVNGKADLTALRLSSHQVSLLLSAIWVQATSTENTPANFETMAHTYNVTLLFTRNKANVEADMPNVEADMPYVGSFSGYRNASIFILVVLRIFLELSSLLSTMMAYDFIKLIIPGISDWQKRIQYLTLCISKPDCSKSVHIHITIEFKLTLPN
ncbi:hypothetical protein CsSME_00012356 [Camellia sinensis var. sinensis]